MMKFRSLLAIAATLTVGLLQAQTCNTYVQPPNELVRNGAMDHFSQPCANLTVNSAANNNMSATAYPCCYWSNTPTSPATANVGTPDYFNTCAPYPTTNAQAGSSSNGNLNWQNFNNGTTPFAYIPVSPHSGTGYSGVSVCQNTLQPDGREYISNQLVSTLAPNTTYLVSVYVRLSPNSEYGIQDLSVLLSAAQPGQTLVINVFPQAIVPGPNDVLVPLNTVPVTNAPVTNKNGWTQLTAQFTTPAASNLSYLTFGNFKTNGTTTLSSLQPVGNVSSFSYYYVDDISLTYVCGPNLTPAISSPSTFCYGSTMTFNGSVTGGTVVNHIWTVIESDQGGAPVANATEWFSPWMTGNPGSYTLPTTNGPQLQCGKYYRVKLAVQNACVGWAEAIKVIYVACPPGVYAGADQTICEGDCVTLSVPGPYKGHTYSWALFSDEPYVISTSPTITVCPTHTTTYCIAVTNNYGCQAYDCVTITVEKAVPDFALAITPATQTYQTLLATPVQQTNLPSGFGFVWFVEEYNANYTTLISTVNSSDPGVVPCWWTFPGGEGFEGYDGTGTMPVLNNSCFPNPGKFKYNTSYRITRGVWSANCGWKQFSVQLHTVKSGEGISEIEYDVKAPDFSGYLTETNQSAGNTELSGENTFTVYPNPSDGLISIDYATGVSENGTMVITDISGRLVQTIRLTSGSGSLTIDMGSSSDGVYLVHLFSGDQLLQTKKIAIHH